MQEAPISAPPDETGIEAPLRAGPLIFGLLEFEFRPRIQINGRLS
jgi:hypothetical protein